eukprot:symbB.v1.2.004161.t1/scaffold235.1/size321457/20
MVGRFARVKLATLKERPELPICLKVLRKTHVVALEQAEHVINEKNVLTSINSPFVIRVMDTFQDHHFLYIAMELVVGGELFTLLRAKKKFEEKAARFFAAEVASALLHLHSMLVVFRDLKPENILVHQTGHIKLTDFGFAKWLFGISEPSRVFQSTSTGVESQTQRHLEFWLLDQAAFLVVAKLFPLPLRNGARHPPSMLSTEMHEGEIKYFAGQKGYGFIICPDFEADVYFQRLALQGAPLKIPTMSLMDTYT